MHSKLFSPRFAALAALPVLGSPSAKAEHHLDGRVGFGFPAARTTTLRATISAAADEDTLEFASIPFSGSAPAPLTFTDGARVVSKDLMIIGPGDADSHKLLVSLKGNSSTRLMEVSPLALAVIVKSSPLRLSIW